PFAEQASSLSVGLWSHLFRGTTTPLKVQTKYDQYENHPVLAFDRFLPLGVRPSEVRVRRVGQDRDELQRMPVRVSKINLSRRHPANHAGLTGWLAPKAAGFDPAVVQLCNRAHQLLERHRESEMASHQDSISSAEPGGWPPQPEHSLALLVRP